MNRIIVLDNVFDDDTVEEFKNIERSDQIVWHPIEEESPFLKMLEVIKEFVDLSECAGYEAWCNKNRIPTDHQDINEQLRMHGILDFPLIGCVYYPFIGNISGAEFHCEDVTIAPRTNRMLLFTPSLWHRVKPDNKAPNTKSSDGRYYELADEGSRVAWSLNPWPYKPPTYAEYLKSKMSPNKQQYRC
jgi:hypothetical protein